MVDKRTSKQLFVALGLALAFVVMAVLVLADQVVWGIALGASVAVIVMVIAFLPRMAR
ncbi:hypothetical protein [Methanomassiliicoccus luminyensis]|uniref:hypothetical protein n=1 Tax=Methanomassiliicoccus luminyensis TaxID=1080712 RepID=UPI00035E2C75|nr:hypothetical protein [Methanomassiliicoccus luminyensis]